jgi:hypothetical protein
VNLHNGKKGRLTLEFTVVILVKLSGGLFLRHKGTLLFPLLFFFFVANAVSQRVVDFLRRTNAVIAQINELFLLTDQSGGVIWRSFQQRRRKNLSCSSCWGLSAEGKWKKGVSCVSRKE